MGTRLNDIITGDLEPLIVRAATTNKLYPTAFSEQFPNDILHYDWNPDNWIKDLAFADAENEESAVIIDGFKGVITYREDKYQNKVDWDFRNIRSRRWKVTIDQYDVATNYVIGDFTESGGKLWVCVSPIIGTTPVEGNYWSIMTESVIENYYFAPADYGISNIPNNNLTVDPNDYEDYLTFEALHSPSLASWTFHNNTIQSSPSAIYFEESHNNTVSHCDLSNNTYSGLRMQWGSNTNKIFNKSLTIIR